MNDTINLLKAMHTIVCHLNNEDAYYRNWIYELPDKPSNNDFKFIADDTDSTDSVIKEFLRIMRLYGKDGIVVNSILYREMKNPANI